MNGHYDDRLEKSTLPQTSGGTHLKSSFLPCICMYRVIVPGDVAVITLRTPDALSFKIKIFVNDVKPIHISFDALSVIEKASSTSSHSPTQLSTRRECFAHSTRAVQRTCPTNKRPGLHPTQHTYNHHYLRLEYPIQTDPLNTADPVE